MKGELKEDVERWRVLWVISVESHEGRIERVRTLNMSSGSLGVESHEGRIESRTSWS